MAPPLLFAFRFNIVFSVRRSRGDQIQGLYTMKITPILAALAAGVSLSGCATVLNGTNIDYATETDPSGANVVFLGGLECTSPCELELRRKDDTRVDISKEGYEPVYVLIQSKLAGSTFGNALAGGLIGAAAMVATERATRSGRARYT